MLRSVLVFVLLLVGAFSDNSEDPRCNKYSNTENCKPNPQLKKALQLATLPSCGKPLVNASNSLVVLIIGDYGIADSICEGQVVQLMNKIKQEWDFDFIMTMGDNNYYNGTCATILENIGQYFNEYYPSGTCVNPTEPPGFTPQIRSSKQDKVIRFFPSPGNHDWDTYISYGLKNLPYIQYFNYLPSFEPKWAGGQFYTVDPTTIIQRKQSLKGLLHLFSINSNLGQTERFGDDAQKQKEWLKDALGNSTAKWKIVYFHHSPYTTAEHDPPATWMRWPFEEWGASAVLTGHEHTYERIERGNSFTYVVNGLGGNPYLYEISGPDCPPVEGSKVRYNDSHGLALAVITPEEFRMCMYSLADGVTKVDEFTINPRVA